jgi:SulP family sulfate permease
VAKVPLAALAGVLFATTVRMVEIGSLRAIMRATPGDAIIVVLTFAVTVAVDLVVAVAVGMGVAMILALRAVAQTAHVSEEAIAVAGDTPQVRALRDDHIVAYRLDGPLFFGAAHRFLLKITDIAEVRIVILRMSRVSTIDATGARILGDAIEQLESRGITVLLSGIAADHDEVLIALGVAEHLRAAGRVFADTPSAIAYAQAAVGVQRQRGSE